MADRFEGHYYDVIMGTMASQITSLCLLNRLFGRRSKKASKLRVTVLCAGNSPVTGEFPAQKASTRKMFPFDDVIMESLWWYRYNIFTNMPFSKTTKTYLKTPEPRTFVGCPMLAEIQRDICLEWVQDCRLTCPFDRQLGNPNTGHIVYSQGVPTEPRSLGNWRCLLSR